MAVHHVTVTLTGSAQAILTPAAGSPSDNCREVQIESETGNAAVTVGGSTVSATDYGASIAAGPSGRIVFRDAGHNINLASTYVFGTVSQKNHVLYIK